MRAFYFRDGKYLRATDMTRGLWTEHHQHGGPAAALLAGALERADDKVFRLARVSVEFMRPVPLAGAFEIVPGPERAGHQVQRLEAMLLADGVEVARASALRLRRDVLGASTVAPVCSLAAPHKAPLFHVPFSQPAYSSAMDIRVVEGAWGELPFGAWSRLGVPLVAGEPTTAIERTMIFADASSGVGPPLDPDSYNLVNPDLTAYFARLPAGDWIGMRVESYASPDGIGLAESMLFDERGPFGRAAQSLLIRARLP
jgi:hypothetical protein